MVMGYPGSSDRYLTYGVMAVELEQPARVKIRRIKLDIMEGQEKTEAVRIQYASKHARVLTTGNTSSVKVLNW